MESWRTEPTNLSAADFPISLSVYIQIYLCIHTYIRMRMYVFCVKAIPQSLGCTHRYMHWTYSLAQHSFSVDGFSVRWLGDWERVDEGTNHYNPGLQQWAFVFLRCLALHFCAHVWPQPYLIIPRLWWTDDAKSGWSESETVFCVGLWVFIKSNNVFTKVIKLNQKIFFIRKLLHC